MSGAGSVETLHLPHGSMWPIVMALGITLSGLGLLLVPLFGLLAPAIGLFVLVFALLGWVREDTRWWREGIGTGDAPGKLGTILFMSSEVFLFGALFATYFAARSRAGIWPDQVDLHLPVLTTAFFSVFLISSSFTIHRAEKLLQRGDKRGFHLWWGGSILLGLTFLGGQVYEYIELTSHGVTLTSGQFASAFYAITGTHGLHVLGGLVFLTIVLVRSLKGQFDEKRHLAPKTAALYWHFVDAIWILVFTVLYIIQ